jgi:glucose dehydrogenase
MQPVRIDKCISPPRGSRSIVSRAVWLGLGLFLMGNNDRASAAGAQSDWPYFGGSKRFDRYSNLGQIDKHNVDKMQVLWIRPGLDPSIHDAFPDIVPSNYLRGTPILVGGVLYAPDAMGLVEAFDAATGATKWVQKPFAMTLKEAAGESTRTVDYWRSGKDQRIIVVRGEYLYALDPEDGSFIAGFGRGGRVSLRRNTPDQAPFFGFNGPIIVGDVIIVGGNGGGKAGGGYGDGGNTVESTPEDIRGYDVRTGALVWTFHAMPQRGDPGDDSWGDSRDRTGNMAAWAPLAADEQRDIVYVPLSAPTDSEYGGHRPGTNLYSCSLVALNARTGKMLWYFQMVHHDLWDYDNSAPPTLADINVNGRNIPAVIQPSKTGFLYVFNRVTGKPVWPIEERPVPQSKIPGEHTSPTQPFPTKPPAFDRQSITDDDLIDYTPELKAAAKKFLADYDVVDGLFAAPSIPSEGKKGTLTVPGGWGAGSWNTGAFDPKTQRYYAVSMTVPGTYNLQKSTDPGAMPYEGLYSSSDSELPYGVGPNGLPLLKGPYGRITAYDMNQGEKLWTVANGDGPRFHPLLKALNLPPLGTIGKPAALVTKTLLFVGESSDAVMGGPEAGIVGPAKFRAYAKDTGEKVWEISIPAGTTGGPITYMAAGRQMIVVPVGGDHYGSGWIALALK